MSASAAVRIEALDFAHRTPDGSQHQVLVGLSLSIHAGEFVALVGPSGSGKSTLLDCLAGLATPAAGTIDIFGQPLTGLNPYAGYLFQGDVLLPWATLLDNVTLGLRLRHMDSKAARTQGRHWLDKVGLLPFARHYPHQLSGGMRRRVALAQMLILRPQLILLDEPFAALDAQTRLRMGELLQVLWREEGCSALFVTHDLEEAMLLADRIVLLSAAPASRVRACFDNPLPRPRQWPQIRHEPAFQQLYQALWHGLQADTGGAP